MTSSEGQWEPWVSAEFGAVPADPADAARYLALVATQGDRVLHQRLTRDNPLRRMGL
jgi:hypothetical protein